MSANPGVPARDYFSLFNIEPGMSLDEKALERTYHTLLSQFHPDRYAGKSAVEQRVAAQFCADVNSGYRTLRNEVTRAEYLLKSVGVDLHAAEREGVDAGFLMTQITLRERLEDTSATDTESRRALIEEITEHYNCSRDRCARSIAASDWSEAARAWQEMCFLWKLLDAAQPAEH